jgi:hypothetical protein
LATLAAFPAALVGSLIGLWIGLAVMAAENNPGNDKLNGRQQQAEPGAAADRPRD